MEFAAFVALRSALGILVLACAVLAEVFGGLWGDVGEELHLHSAQWLPCSIQRGKYRYRLKA